MNQDNYYKEASSAYAGGDDFISPTEINGVFIINRPTFKDDRGFFRENFRKNDLEQRTGLSLDFVQSNHSQSQKATLRGIHIAPWHKLITITRGQVQQVVVDVRSESPTFGQHVSVVMGEDNPVSVFVPAGLGNAYLVLSDTADYTYLVTDYWAPGKEQALVYNDPDLNIPWQLAEPMLSVKDLNNPTLKQWQKS